MMAEERAKKPESKPPKGFRVTVKEEPREKGLAGVAQGARGYILSVNGIEIGRVRRSSPLSSSQGRAWYWSGGGDLGSARIARRNTALERLEWPGTADGKQAALDDLKAYIIAQLWAAEERKVQ